jgi:hypothetical protein
MDLLPPELVDPIVIQLESAATVTRMDPTKDYRILLPDHVKRGSTTLIGGRNVVVVGGAISVPEGDRTRRALYIKDATGTVHVEGIHFQLAGGSEADAIVIAAPRATVQIENVRVDGVHGFQRSWHADVIQPWGGVKALLIDRLTAVTSYQGIQLTALKGPIGSITISRTNIIGADRQIWSTGRLGGNGGFLFWAQCDLEAKVSFDQFYLQPRAERGPRLAAYPPANDSTNCPSVLSGRSLSFPRLRTISGTIEVGAPPGGDFVKAGSVGMGYSSGGGSRR